MPFNSITFIYFFLPLSLIAYYLVPSKFRNTILLISSLVFYAWAGIAFLFLLVFSSIINFVFFVSISRNRNPRTRNKLFVFGVIFNVLFLFVFKYLPAINLAFGLSGVGSNLLGINNFILPLGISYYTFKAISSLVSINGSTNDEKANLIDYLLYLTMFQQIASGPIDRYQKLSPQISNRNPTAGQFISGISRFALGLFKKVIISGPLGIISSQIFALSPENLSAPIAWLGAITFTLQVYYDFSGYTDMAIGLGRFFGFEFSENFNFPFISRSIKEFWRRWHITLSNWLRDYIFQPLAYSLNFRLNEESYFGFRKSDLVYYATTLMTFLLCGFWHGATLPFIIWGLMHGLLVSFEKTKAGNWVCTQYKIVGHIYFLFFIILSFVVFQAKTMDSAIQYLGSMFGFGSAEIYWPSLTQYIDRETSIIYVLAILGASTILQKINLTIPVFDSKNKRIQKIYHSTYPIIIYSGIVLTIIISTIIIISGTSNSFLYFQF